MAAAKKGEVVNASLESGKPVLFGFYHSADGDKDAIQVGSKLHLLAYRELKDEDKERGTGGTWWPL